MPATDWYIVVGLLLTGMAFASRSIGRLPVTPAMVYLAVGVGLGPAGLEAIDFDPVRNPGLLERLAEAAMLVSLLASGLKVRVPFFEPRWWLPVRLATLSMAVTAALLTAVGVWLLLLPVGVAVLLAGILSPTDPVLASEVAVDDWTDRDRVRLGLTAEAAVNDTTAYPVVPLGLGLLGLHDLGAWCWRWAAVDVVWGIASGLGLGAAVGVTASRLVRRLRRGREDEVALDDFLALGLLALTYGLAVRIGGYGFLAAFALGSGLRYGDTRRLDWQAEQRMPVGADELPGLAGSILGLDRHLERFCEFALLLWLGSMLRWHHFTVTGLWFVPLLFLVLRPAAVLAATAWWAASGRQRLMIAWFGIRGIGSVYYLAYALGQGLPDEAVPALVSLTFTTVVASVVLHGFTVQPLQRWYESGLDRDPGPASLADRRPAERDEPCVR